MSKLLISLSLASTLAVSGSFASSHQTSLSDLNANLDAAKVKATDVETAKPTIANTSESSNDSTQWTLPGINPEALKLGLNAYNKLLKEGKTHSPYLTIVDFTQSSANKRLTVINVPSHKIEMQTYVSHGSGSGDAMATRFSDEADTHASSLGVYITGASYDGKHGYSMHVEGLEKGINDNAAARDIEVHPAAYVSQSYAAANGRVGRSWGCFAVSQQVSTDLINQIKGGSVLFAYADQEQQDPYVQTA